MKSTRCKYLKFRQVVFKNRRLVQKKRKMYFYALECVTPLHFPLLKLSPTLKRNVYIFLLFPLLFCSTNGFSQSLVMNEVMSSNTQTKADEDGDYEDWIEIYNYGNTSINLKDYGLTDQTDNLTKWTFPNITIEAKEYLLIWASEKNRTSDKTKLHTNFRIKSGGETLILSNSSGTTLDTFPAVVIATDKSYGRSPDGLGDFTSLTNPTPGTSNSPSTGVNPDKIAINEFLASNDSGEKDEDNEFQDWIEIYNYGTTTVNLANWGLSDDGALPYKWKFPSMNIAAGQYILVWASGKNRTSNTNNLHTSFKISSSGETLYLTDANGLLVSGGPSVSLNPNVSYGRQPNGTGSWLYFTTPTPRASNTGSGTTTTLEPPSFSHNSGLYTSSIDLALSTNVQGATIIYTLDGSEPDIDNLNGTTFTYKNDYVFEVGTNPGELLSETFLSIQYNTPITISDRTEDANRLVSKNAHQAPHRIPPNPVSKATVVRAKTFLNGQESEIVTRTFFVWNGGNQYTDLPIISIVIPEKHLFDYNNGIYTSGVDFDTWREQNPDNNQAYRPENNNYWRSGRDWEFPVNLELFKGNTLISVENINAGFRIHGNNSRYEVVKNLRLYTRDEYSDNDNFNHELFTQKIPGGNNTDRFKRMLIRGNGAGGKIAYDVVFNRLMQPVYNGMTRIQPAIHFINGEYWGFTGIRDRFDDFHFSYNFDVTRDLLVIIDCKSGNCQLDEGLASDQQAFDDFIQWVVLMDMSDENNYLTLKNDLLDVDSYIDHAVIEIFAENNSYELKFWKTRSKENNQFGDGKYRVTVQDFEASLKVDKNWLEEYSDQRNDPDYKDVLGSLLENEDFRFKFINRTADLLNTAFKESRFNEIVNQTFNEVNPILSEDENRAIRQRFYESGHQDDLLNWIKNRPIILRSQITSKFADATGVMDLNINLSHPNAGYIALNTIDVRSSTVGVDADPYPWTGKYFKGIPITLEAKEFPGFTFSHWSGDVNNTNEIIEITPTGDLQLTANYTPDSDYEHVIYYWMFDTDLENDTPFTNIKSTYSRNNTEANLNYTSSLNGYPFTPSNSNWRKGSLERKNNPTAVNYSAFANNDAAYNADQMRGVQIKQPFQSGNLENTVELSFSTLNYEDLKLAFAVESDGAANQLYIEYWNSANSAWVNTNITGTHSISSSYQKVEVDFTNVSIANNQSNFKIRIRFDGTNMTVEEGKAVFINNISITGVDATLSDDAFSLSDNLKVYPNPTTNLVNVQYHEEISKVYIYNTLGQLVSKSEPKDVKTTVNLQNYKAGIYFVKVYANNKSSTVKFIKN